MILGQRAGVIEAEALGGAGLEPAQIQALGRLGCSILTANSRSALIIGVVDRALTVTKKGVSRGLITQMDGGLSLEDKGYLRTFGFITVSDIKNVGPHMIKGLVRLKRLIRPMGGSYGI